MSVSVPTEPPKDPDSGAERVADGRTAVPEGAGTRDSSPLALVDRLRAAVAHALGGEGVDDLRRQSDLRGWTGVGFDRDVDEAIAAVLREMAEAIADDHESGPYWVERTDDGALTAGLVRQVERMEDLADLIDRGAS